MADDRLLVFICTANMCRSPMAGGLLRRRLSEDAGWRVASAGLMAMRGAPATDEARQAMAEIGIHLEGHRSQPVTAELVDEADLLLTMTRSHAAQLIGRFPAADKKTRLLTSFCSDNSRQDIADPVGYPLSVYRRCRDEIESAIADLVLALRDEAAGTRP